jgi:class 3 adenylate cyclase
MIAETQLPDRFRNLIDEQLDIYGQGRSITVESSIPDTNQIPLENPKHWLRIPNVICVFVDMVGSTQLSAEKHDGSTAGAYQLFTGTAVRLFHEFETPYIDVRGDGVFALFNGDQPYRAIAAAVTFKTFAEEVFGKIIKDKTGLSVGSHIGIDQRTVLVRKIGLKRNNKRSDRQNEVWAGRPINMASKLASLASEGQLITSDRYYDRISDDRARQSCGCPNGDKAALWKELDLSEDQNFDFDVGFLLESKWCTKHGAEYCEAMLRLDDE